MDMVLPMVQPLTHEEVDQLIESIKLHPDHYANKFRLAIHYVGSGADHEAEQLFRELLDSNPRHTEARLAWAAMHADNSDLDLAIEQLTLAGEYDGMPQGDSRIHFSMGYCLERQGNKDEAEKYYQKACGEKPCLPRHRQRLAAIYLSRHHYDMALNQYHLLKDEEQHNSWYYLLLGQLYLNQNDYLKAEYNFEQALISEPDNFEFQDEQIEKMVEDGKVQEAIETLEHRLAEQGDFPDIFAQLGDLHSRLGSDHDAVNFYKRALEIHPGYLEASVKLGTQHLRMGRYFESACQFNQSIEINDRLIEAYVGLALSHMKLDKTTPAHDMIDLASALEPNTILLFKEMNCLQFRVDSGSVSRHDLLLGTDEKSNVEPRDALHIQQRRYEQALTENPNNANLHYYYAMLLRTGNRNLDCIQHLQRALTINPSYFKARIKLGLMQYQEGETKAAFDAFDEAFHNNEEYLDLHYKLGLMYCDKIQFALAVEYFDLSQNESTKPEIEANLALALKNMNLVDRNTAAWRCICEMDPANKWAYLTQRSLTKLPQFPI